MKVVVTGASGFIGGHLLRALLERGDEVVAISRRAPLVRGVDWRELDILDPRAGETGAKAEAIVHLAALSDASLALREPLRYGQVNALGAATLLEAAREGGAAFVLASSQRVYRPSHEPLAEGAAFGPSDPYGYSKLIAEQWLGMYRELYGLRATSLRFFSVYGPGQDLPGGTSGVVSILLHRALAGEGIWVDGDKRRDLTYVGDVVDGIIAALAHRGSLRPAYNIATGIGTPLAELARMVLEVTGSGAELSVREGGALEDLVADISMARADLGYAPRIGLREGLERTYDAIRR